MKQTLFIDTNIYMRFYDSNSKEFKKLLNSIEEVKDNIFITKQIQMEIERNKLDVFITSFISYEKQFGLNKTSLPEHLESSADQRLKEWNIATDKLVKEVKEQKKKLKDITEKLIENISENKDEVSQKLDKIFSTSQSPTLNQIDNARKRKEIGNPPGKNNDPLGDQISWEQILDKTNSIEELWIITNDNDYMFEFDKKCYLNAFLTNELKQKNKSIKIYCFNTLSEGLRSFNKSKTISALPTEKELKEIITEEKKSNIIQNINSFITGSTGTSGSFGTQGISGYTRYSGTSGSFGTQGISGYSGHSGTSGSFGTQGISGDIEYIGTLGSFDNKE